MQMATAVPTKGSSGRFGGEKVLEFMDECGDLGGDVIVKKDQEPAIEVLVQDIVSMRGDERGKRTVVEESPVGSHASNGIVERAVQGIEGQIRVMKSALEARLQRKVATERRIVMFMAEYGAHLMNRLEVGKDGKTAYERSRGKRGKVVGVEFGEKLIYKTKTGTKMEKINARWELGIFAGVRRRSGEMWIATKEGMKKARSVRRIPEEQRWSVDCLDWVKNVPWNKGDGEEGDGEIPEEKLEEGSEREVKDGGVVYVNVRDPIPREFYIKQEDGVTHGYTRGCPGCSSWFKGKSRKPHSEKCRDRFRDVMEGEARVKNAEVRKKAFTEKHKRKQDDSEKGGEETEAKKDRKTEVKVGEQVRSGQQVGGSSSSAGEGKKRSGGHIEEMEADAQREDQGERQVKRKAEEQEVRSVTWEAYMKGEGYTYDGRIGRWTDLEEEITEKEINEVSMKLIEEVFGEERETNKECEEVAWDDVKGGMLDIRKVREGRKEEVEYMEKRGIWEVKDEKECWEKTGKGPVSVKWVDTDKGDRIRCRLVARDFKKKGERDREDLFCGDSTTGNEEDAFEQGGDQEAET